MNCEGRWRDGAGGFCYGRVLRMARLKTLAPRIGGLKARVAGIGGGSDRAGRRDQVLEWRQWYKTKRWQRLRWLVLVRDQFTCRMCGALEASTRLLVADHVQPHRGDAALFWAEGNLQTLCKACHDGAKQAAERRGEA